MIRSARPTVLLFGAGGSIGQALGQELGADHQLLRCSSRPGQDLHCDFAQLDFDGLSIPADTKLDAVVFAQGANPAKSAQEITAPDFERMLRLNVVGPTLALQRLAPRLAPDAAVVFFSSVAAKKGSYDPSYAASKASLDGLMHSLANAYPAQRFNIISLGLVEGSTVHRGMTEDFVKKHRDRMRGQRLIASADVAALVREVIRNQSMNRAVLALDAGFS